MYRVLVNINSKNCSKFFYCDKVGLCIEINVKIDMSELMLKYRSTQKWHVILVLTILTLGGSM
jgi:hypothetical protein